MRLTPPNFDLGSTSRAASVAAAALLVVAASAGCYRPVIDDGGFKCASSGKKCPTGLTCGYDNRCYEVPPTPPVSDASDGKLTSDAADAGDVAAESMCALPVVTPTCQDAPASGQACSPSCQTGCTCGRCNVVGKIPACVSAGAKKLGDACKVGTGDDCEAGLICRRELCGNGLARCYKHCTKSDQCGGSFCQLSIDDDAGKATGFLVCDVAPRTCDPVTNTGCPDPALNCYLTGSTTTCDCPGNPAKPAQAGEDCHVANDCAGGLFCVGGVGGVATPRCRFVCNIASPSCLNNAPCEPVGTKYGYCKG